MLLMKFSEFGCTGYDETSVFHALLAGSTPQPPITGPPPVAGVGVRVGVDVAVRVGVRVGVGVAMGTIVSRPGTPMSALCVSTATMSSPAAVSALSWADRLSGPRAWYSRPRAAPCWSEADWCIDGAARRAASSVERGVFSIASAAVDASSRMPVSAPAPFRAAS
jgi:hypothetical protein